MLRQQHWAELEYYLEMYASTADASLLKYVPDDVSPRKMASRGGAVHWRQPPGAGSFLVSRHSIVIMLAASPAFRFAFEAEKSRTFDAVPGMIGIGPAGVDCKASWSAATESVIVRIWPESMGNLAGHEFDCPEVELRPVHHTIDRSALQFARMIRAELNRPDRSNEIYLDALVTLLGIHVLRKYSSAAEVIEEVKGGLSNSVAKRVREYVHEHFRRKLTISELAATCGLSRGYFMQAFGKTFGMPPHRYVLESRLDFAEMLLCETELPVAEIAFLSGFSSPSHLTSMMGTHRHKTPRQFR